MQLILFPFRNSVLQKAITIKNKLYKVMAFIHTLTMSTKSFISFLLSPYPKEFT